MSDSIRLPFDLPRVTIELPPHATGFTVSSIDFTNCVVSGHVFLKGVKEGVFVVVPIFSVGGEIESS